MGLLGPNPLSQGASVHLNNVGQCLTHSTPLIWITIIFISFDNRLVVALNIFIAPSPMSLTKVAPLWVLGKNNTYVKTRPRWHSTPSYSLLHATNAIFGTQTDGVGEGTYINVELNLLFFPSPLPTVSLSNRWRSSSECLPAQLFQKDNSSYPTRSPETMWTCQSFIFPCSSPSNTNTIITDWDRW